jgi:YWFCY motif protein/type IV secretory system conjugative DNA transfer VirD4/TraG family protein
MALNTGENEQGLKKIIDMTRLISVSILMLHFYNDFYAIFKHWSMATTITDRLLHNLSKTGLLDSALKSKSLSLALLLLSLLGVKGRKSETITYSKALMILLPGISLYFATSVLIYLPEVNPERAAILYMTFTGLGYILIVSGGGMLTRIIKNNLQPGFFNTSNETFPQEERLLTNEYSINLPASYNLRGKMKKSWINIINPMRGLLVAGSPGAGKSYFIIENVIRQHIEKGYTMFIYDYKYDDLTTVAYNHYLKYKNAYETKPAFYVINFDDLAHSHRCNPLDPGNMYDITDAAEAARIILLGLNRSWLKKQGDFFVESPINFLTALIWFLKKYENGVYCTLPHVIELMQTDIEKLFTVLRTEPEIEAYINPFISAFQTNSMEQLEGQLDAGKISMAKLSSPNLYYSLSGNDFSLDINNPAAPKIVSLANNPQKQETYGPILSLYMTRLTKIINQKNRLKSSLIIDEFTTLTFLGLDTLIATGRSNKISTTIAIQDSSQLRLHYGKEMADVIVNICGNIIVGQVGGELAKQISERLGKTLQDRQSVSINSSDTSISKSKQLEVAVPVSTIASLSSGEFVGMVADNPDQLIELKTFHCSIMKPVSQSNADDVAVPIVSSVDAKLVNDTYLLIKSDIQDLVETVLEEIINDPARADLLVRKG